MPIPAQSSSRVIFRARQASSRRSEKTDEPLPMQLGEDCCQPERPKIGVSVSFRYCSGYHGHDRKLDPSHSAELAMIERAPIAREALSQPSSRPFWSAGVSMSDDPEAVAPKLNHPIWDAFMAPGITSLRKATL